MERGYRTTVFGSETLVPVLTYGSLVVSITISELSNSFQQLEELAIEMHTFQYR